MSLSHKKIILSALFAITLILLTNHFSSLIPKFPDFIVSIIHILPYFLILFIIAISLKHNLSRDLNLALSFIIVYWILKNLIWPTDTNDATATILFVIIGPILAINFLFIIRTAEKGIFNKNGLHHLYLVLFELAVLIWFVNYTPELLLKYLYYPYFVSPIFDATAMYQSTIIINSIVFIILLINALKKQKVEMTGFLGAFISIVLAQHYINSPATSMMFFTVACLILILTIGLNNFSLSKIDQLTNLPSYRSFKNQLNTLHDRYCIAIIDIDEFKELIDEYGQDICDQILRMIASRSQRLGRKGFPYRYKNEEFALIFYDMNLHEANKYLATLCDSIANEPFLIRSKKRPFFKPNSKTDQPASKRISKPIPISVSVGIAEKQAHHQNPSEVLTTAHEALARVKEQQQYFATI